jgi:hypothetical protein
MASSAPLAPVAPAPSAPAPHPSATASSSSSLSSSSGPAASPAPLEGWLQQVSRKTGKPYWFNVKTSASVWEEPPEYAAARAALASGGGPRAGAGAGAGSGGGGASSAPQPSSSSSTPSHSAIPPTDPRAFAAANRGILAARDSVPAYRDAAESICAHLRDGKDTLTYAPGVHRFPPTENRTLRFVVFELAEEYELQCDTLGADEARHVAVWRKGCEPPEVAGRAEEEARLTREAAQRRALEAELEDKARKERGADKAMLADGAGGAGAGSDFGHPSAGAGAGGGGGAVAGGHVDGADVVAVVPLFRVKDKRSIGEIQDELKAKRMKLSHNGAEA